MVLRNLIIHLDSKILRNAFRNFLKSFSSSCFTFPKIIHYTPRQWTIMYRHVVYARCESCQSLKMFEHTVQL